MPDTSPSYILAPSGLTYRLHPDGARTLMVPSGGAVDTDPDTGDDDDGGAGDGRTDDGKVLTQAQIDSIVGRAERRAEQRARKAIEEKLGMGVDDVTSFVEQQRQADEERMSDAEKRERKAQEREQAAEARERAATEKLNRARVTAALIDEGADRKAARRLAATVDVSPDADDDDVAEAVAALREELPALFSGSPDDTGTGAPPTPRLGTRGGAKQLSNGGLDPAKFAEDYVDRQAQGAAELPTL